MHLPLRRGLLQQVMGPVIIRGPLSGCAPDEPVACTRLLCNHVNCKYLPGRAPPTHSPTDSHTRLVERGTRKVDRKEVDAVRVGRIDAADRKREREREREDRLKIPKWITPLHSWNRFRGGEGHCCPHEWKFPFFFLFCFRISRIGIFLFRNFLSASGFGSVRSIIGNWIFYIRVNIYISI